MIRPFGDGALLVELESVGRSQALAASLREEPIDGVTAAVPGLASVLVELSLEAPPGVAEMLERRIRDLPESARPTRHRRIPIVYGGEHGPDLEAAAAMCGMRSDELAARHAASELRVLFCGFAPGFAYLGELPAALQVPRLGSPRSHTPAGSVAIAGSMSGIYPADLPGGWRVIGRTPLPLFDPRRDPPAYLAPGDLVTFAPRSDWPGWQPPAEDW